MKRLLLILSVSLLSLNSIAQRAIYHEQLRPNYVLKVSPGIETNAETRQVLALLAEAQGARPGGSAELVLQLEMEKKIVRDNARQLTASVHIKNISISGSQQVRGFSLQDVLFPSQVSFRYSVLDNRPLNRALDFNADLPVRDRAAGPAESRFTDSTEQQFRMEVTLLRFRYNQRALDNVKSRLALIHDYYAAESSIRLAYDLLNRVQPSDVERMDQNMTLLQEVEIKLLALERKSYTTALDLHNYDPVKYLQAMQELRTGLSAKRSALDQVRATIHLYHYHAGLDLISRSRRVAARDAFKRSLFFLPHFAPAAYHLARMDYQDGYFYEAECRVVEIMQQMDPDPDTRFQTVELAKQIYGAYLNESERKIEGGDYQMAVDYLQKAKHLCQEIRGLVCDERLAQGFRKARKGWYDSYLSQARTAYSSGDLDQSERLVNKALQMHRQYASDVQSDTEARSMQRAIRQKRYEKSLDHAGAYLAARNYKQALSELQNAEAQRLQYELVTSSQEASLGKDVARPVCLQLVADAEQQASRNDLAAARKLASDAKSLQSRYQLDADPEVALAMAGLQQKIFSKECENAKLAYDRKLDEARVAMAARTYRKSKDLLDAALQIAAANRDCGISTDYALSAKDSILPAATYQELIDRILDLQTRRNFDEAVRRYKEAGPYFSQFNLNTFGLEHLSLPDFAISRGNHTFLQYLIRNATQKGELEQALKYCEALHARKLHPKVYKQELRDLGLELGKRDKAAEAADRKNGASRYLSKEQGLRYLCNGYKKAWK